MSDLSATQVIDSWRTMLERYDADPHKFGFRANLRIPEVRAILDLLAAETRRADTYKRALERIAAAGTGIPDWRAMAQCAADALVELAAGGAPGRFQREQMTANPVGEVDIELTPKAGGAPAKEVKE